MSLKSFFIFSIPAIGLLHSCATTNNWQNDDVYSLKEPEVPIGTDINDETDYSAYVYNRRSLDRQQQYYSDRQPATVNRNRSASMAMMGPSMYMMYGNPYGMGMGMGYGFGYGSRYGYNPYGYGGYGYSPYGYGYGYPYGYGSPYYGYSPYGYSPYYGYGSPYYGGYSPYGYSPYYGYGGYGAYGGYGYGGNYYGNSGSGGSSGNTFYGHRSTYAGVGGTSSRPNGAVQIAKPNTPNGGTTTKPVGNGNVAEKSVSRQSLTAHQSAREVSGLSTPGTNRPTAAGAVRSQSGFNTRPVVARTTDHVRTAAPSVGGGRVYTPASSSGGRIQNTGRINSGNGNVSSPRTYESRPVMSSPGRVSSPGGNFGGGSRPSGGGGVRSGGSVGGGGRR